VIDLNLPKIISDYVNASNAHDVDAILACFSESATVRDEGQTLQGKKAIKGWGEKTIEKYKFHFEPLSIAQKDGEIVVEVKVSGTFDGSPVTLDYHFVIESEKISSFAVK
jgi:ketosteroid isomerase-like protein